MSMNFFSIFFHLLDIAVPAMNLGILIWLLLSRREDKKMIDEIMDRQRKILAGEEAVRASSPQRAAVSDLLISIQGKLDSIISEESLEDRD